MSMENRITPIQDHPARNETELQNAKVESIPRVSSLMMPKIRNSDFVIRHTEKARRALNCYALPSKAKIPSIKDHPNTSCAVFVATRKPSSYGPGSSENGLVQIR